MSDRNDTRGPDVVVEEADAPPVDVDAWVARYVRTVLELEGIRPRVAPPRVRSVG